MDAGDDDQVLDNDVEHETEEKPLSPSVATAEIKRPRTADGKIGGTEEEAEAPPLEETGGEEEGAEIIEENKATPEETGGEEEGAEAIEENKATPEETGGEEEGAPVVVEDNEEEEPLILDTNNSAVDDEPAAVVAEDEVKENEDTTSVADTEVKETEREEITEQAEKVEDEETMEVLVEGTSNTKDGEEENREGVEETPADKTEEDDVKEVPVEFVKNETEDMEEQSYQKPDDTKDTDQKNTDSTNPEVREEETTELASEKEEITSETKLETTTKEENADSKDKEEATAEHVDPDSTHIVNDSLVDLEKRLVKESDELENETSQHSIHKVISFDQKETFSSSKEASIVSRSGSATSGGVAHSLPEMENPLTALVPVWSFGLNRNVAMLNLSTDSRRYILYTCAHLGILFDFQRNRQLVLQGHSNTVTCTGCSLDKRWIVTGDSGPNSMVIIWDSNTGIPVRSMFEPHPNGVAAVALSPDARYLATVSAEEGHQTFAVWDWTTGEDSPMVSATIDAEFGWQHMVAFNQADSTHLVSNSDNYVIFYCWKGAKLDYFPLTVTDRDFNKPVGRFSNSIFLHNSTRALTATSQGLCVVWDSNKPLIKESQEATPDKKAVKLVPMHDRAITVLVVLESLIVTGDTAGHVKFFDHNLMLMYWYQNFNFGSINSISFQYSPQLKQKIRPESVNSPFSKPASAKSEYYVKSEKNVDLSSYPTDSTIPENRFVIDDFVIGTNNAVFASIDVSTNKVQIIQRDHDSPIHSLATHPSLDRVATAGFSGLLKVWCYSDRTTIVSRYFDKGNQITCIGYDPKGCYLAIGFHNGVVRVLDAETLFDATKEPFHYARKEVTHVVFSDNSEMLATVDAEFTTSLFTASHNVLDAWHYLGRHRAHYKEIKDITFGSHIDSGEPRLMTLGADRFLVEYDLKSASRDNLPLLSSHKVEQSSLPLSMTWYPSITKEQFICTSNDEFKIKLYNSTTFMCRKTILGPTYGSPIEKMMVLPENPSIDASQDSHRYMIFHVKDQVGILKLPLDGNPHNATTMVAHPSGVSNLACSHDGKYVFTAGGSDSTVHMWRVYNNVLEAQSTLGGSDLTPFYDLLDGGRSGELFSQLEDYFYYAQLRSQGINTMDTREVSTHIPVAEIPFVMRAMGFYPTEQEIEDMLNEVKYEHFVETGEYKLEVDLGQFIRLYINHRPAFGLSMEKIRWAFNILGASETDRDEEEPVVGREALFDILQSNGEHMLEYELAEYLTTLLGFNPEGGSCELNEFDPSRAGDLLEEKIPKNLTADQFTRDILCLGAGTAVHRPYSQPATHSQDMSSVGGAARSVTSAGSQTLVDL